MTNKTIASKSTPAPASQIQGSDAHATAPLSCGAPKVATHNKYSAVGSSSGKTIVKKTRIMTVLAAEHLGQIHQHPSGCTPDVAVPVWQHKEYPAAFFEHALCPPMIARVEDEGQRYFENIGDFERV